jgi:hypothetical protein
VRAIGLMSGTSLDATGVARPLAVGVVARIS